MIALALTLVLAGSDGGPPSQELQKVLGGDFRTVTTVRVLGVKGEGINLDQLSKVLEGQSHPGDQQQLRESFHQAGIVLPAFARHGAAAHTAVAATDATMRSFRQQPSP